jgi:tRNA(adenine34) deaminase
MLHQFSFEDHTFMKEALKEAKKSFTKGEVPVGSVLVFQGKIIAKTHNQTETLKDPTAHAELLCIRHAANVKGDWRLLKTTLYTTLEPCSMCAGALLLARVERVVWGAPDLRHGAHGSWIDLFSKTHPTHRIDIKGGLLEDESGELLRIFFRQRRAE